MLLGQPDKIPNAAGAGFKQGCNTYQEEPCSEYGCLNERKPIVTQPLGKGHVSIIPDPMPVSSVRGNHMPASPLPNYIRTYRKRACLTQEDVAFLLGSKSSANVSRHERFKQIPDLPTLLAYELLFRTPVRGLFSNAHQEIEKKLRNRIRLLIRKLIRAGNGRRIAKKIETLTAYLGEEPKLRRA